MNDLYRFSFLLDGVRHHTVARGPDMESVLQTLKEQTKNKFGQHARSLLIESTQDSEEVLKSWIPVYNTGVVAVAPAFLNKSKWEVLSQYGFILTDPIEDLSIAIETAYRLQAEKYKKYNNKDDAPIFK